MIKIGITGQAGFIGTHLYNTLGLDAGRFQRIPFQRDFFHNTSELVKFVSQCDVVIHLAAMNRHNDPQIIHDTNMQLVRSLIRAMENTGSKPHVLFASSIQEGRSNPYGQSKKEGRLLLEEWATRNHARFNGLIIPNVFGPFGHPCYNSVVATFCHQLTHGEQPKIDVDGHLKLIYVGELVQEIIKYILAKPSNDHQSAVTCPHISHTSEARVSMLLDRLEYFKTLYFEKRIIPNLETPFDRNLFNTFVCSIDHASFYPGKLIPNTDQRGRFVEVLKLGNTGGQVSFSSTVPGITRGNHYHTRKFERFAIIKGKARINIRRIGTDEVLSFELDGKEPAFVDMPIWYTHNITNIGNDEVYTIFWINEFYDPEDSDTYFEKV